jgi:zinc transport system substrate-binding protein
VQHERSQVRSLPRRSGCARCSHPRAVELLADRVQAHPVGRAAAEEPSRFGPYDLVRCVYATVMIRSLFLSFMLLMPLLGRAEPLQVFVSVLPLKTFVEKVGGDHVAVQVMVRPGHSPATYEPTPQQIAALARTALYVRIGVPFENAWMPRIRSADPRMRILDARSGIDLRDMEGHSHEADVHPNENTEGSGTERDAHVWTSPPLVKRMARNIRDALIELDPVHTGDYRRNYAAFADELDALDRELRTLLNDARGRKFMVFHPAWGYFADTYGLVQVPIEKEGKEPGARALTALIEQGLREHVKIIFVQPQFNERSAQQVARAIGGRVVAIDPLSPDYAENLHKVARLIAEAVR